MIDDICHIKILMPREHSTRPSVGVGTWNISMNQIEKEAGTYNHGPRGDVGI